MFRELTSSELDAILSSIHREQHFLYYSYLTHRKQNTVHYGQYTDEGELLGVMAYLWGLPFHAFSVYPMKKSFCLRSMLSFMREQLELPNDAVGSFITNEEEMEVLSQQIEFLKPSRKLLLMKHIHQEALPPEDQRVMRLGTPYFEHIESKMKELHTMAFTKEELCNPFYGVLEQEELIAVGGYHIYSEDYVELGNIGTDAAWRRQGYGKKVCTELTRKGRSVTPNVYLNVIEENVGAIGLYRSIGYEVICNQFIVEFVI
ncbi:GNAT family N-acetyltransferase [Paenibacillus dokdonensis]|uniref:GNAT family N-acetyltransferase n=1 Tax=Paenibacillus dokdonensis TaxID=2567944 RepID=A0ABU6GKN4_9BACL|nr:GNAT family N-acetyltransferase [Paenibacillus dokdonensis]MEC0240306.1 GNAT family N-acetyltransferase [Paenibacillus dokdonensis]